MSYGWLLLCGLGGMDNCGRYFPRIATGYEAFFKRKVHDFAPATIDSRPMPRHSFALLLDVRPRRPVLPGRRGPVAAQPARAQAALRDGGRERHRSRGPLGTRTCAGLQGREPGRCPGPTGAVADLELPGFGIGPRPESGGTTICQCTAVRLDSHCVRRARLRRAACATLRKNAAPTCRRVGTCRRRRSQPSSFTTAKATEIEITAESPLAARRSWRQPRRLGRRQRPSSNLWQMASTSSSTPGYQSMFVVDPAGVLITDPISRTAALLYLAEVRKLTSAPIRYVVCSHHHYRPHRGRRAVQGGRRWPRGSTATRRRSSSG